MATNASKSVSWQEHYDPYGQKLNGVAEKAGYTGHAFDPETNYAYAQARFYARWLAVSYQRIRSILWAKIL